MKMADTPPRRAGASLAQRAYEQVRSAILRGQLPLGSAISRRGLAAELGMSIVPVGEALQRLETEGLVESRPRSGTTVCRPSRADIRGHYVVREALETQAARLFAEHATPQQRAELRKLAARLDRAYADRRAEMHDTFLLHAQLHHRIAECAGCPALMTAIEKSHVLVLNWLYNGAAAFRDLPKRWHRDLADVLAAGDVEAADAQMRRHVRFALDDVLQRLETSEALDG